MLKLIFALLVFKSLATTEGIVDLNILTKRTALRNWKNLEDSLSSSLTLLAGHFLPVKEVHIIPGKCLRDIRGVENLHQHFISIKTYNFAEVSQDQMMEIGSCHLQMCALMFCELEMAVKSIQIANNSSLNLRHIHWLLQIPEHGILKDLENIISENIKATVLQKTEKSSIIIWSSFIDSNNVVRFKKVGYISRTKLVVLSQNLFLTNEEVCANFYGREIAVTANNHIPFFTYKKLANGTVVPDKGIDINFVKTFSEKLNFRIKRNCDRFYKSICVGFANASVKETGKEKSSFHGFFYLSVAALYSGVLTSVYAVSTLEKPVDSLEDIVRAGDVVPLTLKGTSNEYYFRSAQSGVRQEVFKLFSDDSYIESQSAGLRKVLLEKGKWVTTLSTLNRKSNVKDAGLQTDKFHFGKTPFFFQGYGIALQEGSICREKFNELILYVLAGGLEEMWKRENLFRYGIDEGDKQHKNPDPVTITNIQGGLYLLLAGEAIAFVFFVVEISISKTLRT